MKYFQFSFIPTPNSTAIQDVLCAVLGEAGFDSFEPADDGAGALQAYIRQDAFDKSLLESALASFPIDGVNLRYDYKEAEDKDWNAIWEQNYFRPIVVDGRCVVAGTMHRDVPAAQYHITIDPRMSFGTGHHATTSQMLSELLRIEVEGLDVLDMGCGTGILAILARMRGARSVLAIDNDEWCVSNTLDNLALNNMDCIDVRLGDATALKGTGPFGIILANINRNILLSDMDAYADVMKPGSLLLTSGYYTDDLPVLQEKAASLNLRLVHTREHDRWCQSTFCLSHRD